MSATDNNLQLVTLPPYVEDIAIRTARHSGVKSLYFNFEPRSVPSKHIVNLYYQAGGVTDPHSVGMVLVERRNQQTHLAVFDSVTEAVAALSRLPMRVEFVPPAGAGEPELAGAFVDYCITHGLIAPYYNHDASQEAITCLQEALANEGESRSAGDETIVERRGQS